MQENMQLPKVSIIRQTIQTVKNPQIQKALKYQYLICGRAKEVIYKTTEGDKSGHNKPTGPTGTDARLENFAGQDIAIFNVFYTKKGRGFCVKNVKAYHVRRLNSLLTYFCQFKLTYRP